MELVHKYSWVKIFRFDVNFLNMLFNVVSWNSRDRSLDEVNDELPKGHFAPDFFVTFFELPNVHGIEESVKKVFFFS